MFCVLLLLVLEFRYSTVVLLIKTHIRFLIKKNINSLDELNFKCPECYRAQDMFVLKPNSSLRNTSCQLFVESCINLEPIKST